MPCEGCTAQFTVFKRKRNCSECRRYYCNQCLTKRNNLILCERCLIFTKRPLYKIDLQKLKAKDLIFFLQSKHISTTGCVEKDELVNLILLHVNSSSSINSNNSSRHNSTTNNIPKRNSPDGDNTNPFNQLKQSCQSFFSTVSEKIQSEINFGDSPKSPTSPTSSSGSSKHQQQSNISDQPRIITREIPTYASKNNVKDKNKKTRNTTNPLNSPNSPTTPIDHTVPNISSSTSSPILSLSSISSQSISSQQQQQQQQSQNYISKPNDNSTNNVIPKIHKTANNRKIFETVINNDNSNNGGNSSGCECSDDEIITKFEQEKCKEKLSPTTTLSSSQTDSGCDEQNGSKDDGAGPSCSTGPISKNSSLSIQNKDFDDSSGSSFEELGAVGGINNEITNNSTPAAAGNNSDNVSGCTTNSSDNENWQIINKDENNQQQQKQNLQNDKENNEIELNSFQLKSQSTENTEQTEPHSITNTTNEKSLVVFGEPSSITLNNLRFGGITPSQRHIIRRRSDGFINNRHNRLPINDELIDFGIASSSGRNISRVDEEDSNDDIGAAGDNCTDEMPSSRKRLKKSCSKCGKTKKNLKRHVDKFKKHLESKKLSEQEIKEELKAFLEFLECRQKSIDCSSDDSGESNTELLTEAEFRQRIANDYEVRFLYNDNNDDDGIHVYAHNDNEFQMKQSRFDSRFINLSDFNSIDEFDDLTVKQLKEILMLNRVDFKGCCEKQELLERVHRLWKNLQESPAIDKLPVDDLCKICMDAPIECVILECGHMATCTNCGKVLSECPICRQYIVRVVRFFRA